MATAVFNRRNIPASNVRDVKMNFTAEHDENLSHEINVYHTAE